MDVQQIITQASQAVQAVGLSKAWGSVKWNIVEKQLFDVDAQVSSDGVDIFPSIRAHQEPAKILVIEFGHRLVMGFNPIQKARWTEKLVHPLKEQVDAAQHALEQGHATYSKAVESLKTAVGRLVAIHLYNGLIFNQITIAEAAKVDLRSWGTTSQLANLSVPFSLIPLLSAYAPKKVYDDYGVALSDLAFNSMKSVKETTVGEAFKTLIMSVAS